MPFEIIVTKKTDMAWDGGKATEDLIPNAGDLVFDSTGGGSFDLVFPTQTAIKEVSGLKIEQAVIDFSPDQDELGWATDNNRVDTNGGTHDDTTLCDSGSLSVLLAFGEPVTFTATVSQNSPPASPEPVTYTGGRFALDIDGHSSSPLSLYDLIV